MEIVSVIGMAVLATFLALLIKREHPAIAFILAVGAAILILLFALGRLSSLLDVFRQLAERTGINLQYFNLLLKIIGIAYLAEFGAQFCRDAGQETIAGAVELAGKAIILLLSVPILIAVFDLTLKLFPR
ncbi:MAG: stage sporulation protein [Bacillota bacterium]|nr:stage sporulation protein [Bacillota bacterium]MDK2926126.1 stage sporulation protein [Bacillota bacterium]MDK2960473.1 stage sporulation protein [Bacillota bacterium]